MNWPDLVSSIPMAAVVGLAFWIAAYFAWAVCRWIRAQADKSDSDAVLAEAKAELKLAKARSINADTEEFARRPSPAPATVH